MTITLEELALVVALWLGAPAVAGACALAVIVVFSHRVSR